MLMRSGIRTGIVVLLSHHLSCRLDAEFVFCFRLVYSDLKSKGNVAQGVSATVLKRALSSKVPITSMLFFVLGWNNFKKYFQWA